MLKVSLEKYRGLRVCVAVSGGADSVCLLHLFKEQAPALGITLSALTCEHGIRGENSKRDVQFVKSLCEAWKIPLRTFSADVPARAKASGRGLEEEGRKFRYECFAEVLKCEADAVATAHHQGDVAETVLFRLARGTSLAGLSAIRERDGIVRPLLDVSKAQIEEYIQENGLPYRTDETNADTAYSRNAIRAEVLPALEKVSAGACGHIVEFSRRAAEDDSYLQILAERRIRQNGREYRISAQLPPPLFTRACVRIFKLCGIEQDYTAANVNGVVGLIRLQSGRKTCLPNGLTAIREGEDLVFFLPVVPSADEIPFGFGEYCSGEYIVSVQEAVDGNLYADFDAFPSGCVVRTRREGDYFQPYKGKRKPLKKYLTDKKIPARIGRSLPLVAKDNDIYAVFGVEISDSVKVTEHTRTRVGLSLNRTVSANADSE